MSEPLANATARLLREAVAVTYSDDGGPVDELRRLGELAADALDLKQKQCEAQSAMIGDLATILGELPLPDLPQVVRLREIMARVRLTVSKPEGPTQ